MKKNEIINQTTFCYTIEHIANWQKEISATSAKSKISLPSLQRGFVWKTSQIESLWDSLLRGYPIGALLMNKVAEDKKELLDGIIDAISYQEELMLDFKAEKYRETFEREFDEYSGSN